MNAQEMPEYDPIIEVETQMQTVFVDAIIHRHSANTLLGALSRVFLSAGYAALSEADKQRVTETHDILFDGFGKSLMPSRYGSLVYREEPRKIFYSINNHIIRNAG